MCDSVCHNAELLRNGNTWIRGSISPLRFILCVISILFNVNIALPRDQKEWYTEAWCFWWRFRLTAGYTEGTITVGLALALLELNVFCFGKITVYFRLASGTLSLLAPEQTLLLDNYRHNQLASHVFSWDSWGYSLVFSRTIGEERERRTYLPDCERRNRLSYQMLCHCRLQCRQEGNVSDSGQEDTQWTTYIYAR